MRKLLLPVLIAVTLGVVFVTVSAQTATRMFATLSTDLTTGTSTPVTCTQSGTGCFLDVTISGGTSATLPSFVAFGGTTSAFPALKRSGTTLLLRLADDTSGGTFGATNLSYIATLSNGATGFMLLSATAPTISSGFGTSPSIVSSAGSATFRVNVGTGGAATSGVIGMPAASTGWNCTVQDMTNNTATRQTASTTTSVTFTAAAAWAASDVLLATCFAY